MSKKRDKLVAAVFEHYIKPGAETKLQKRMRKAMEHALTCGDLSHGHGLVKVSWEPPPNK